MRGLWKLKTAFGLAYERCDSGDVSSLRKCHRPPPSLQRGARYLSRLPIDAHFNRACRFPVRRGLGLLFAFQNTNASASWPPAGLGVGGSDFNRAAGRLGGVSGGDYCVI